MTCPTSLDLIKEIAMSENGVRYVALDVHKSYVMVGAVNSEQVVIMHPHKVPVVDFEAWATKHLRPTDSVVMEVTTNAWTLYDLLEPLVEDIIIVPPHQIKLIAQSYVKTDRRDTLTLAKLLAANLAPAVWVPPKHIRELRALVNHRQHLVSERAAAKNRLRSMLHAYQIIPPDRDLFGQANRSWWDALHISKTEKLRASHLLLLIDYLTAMIDQIEAEFAQVSVEDPWARQLPFLLQVPGVALVTAMTILAAIGDVTRFSTAKKLVGYSGLGARIHASGMTHHSGGITKQGRKDLRKALVEASWMAVRYHPHWQSLFHDLTSRLGKQRAIVAIARKLLVVIWHVLTYQAADRLADPAAVTRKFLKWADCHRLATSRGYSRAAFAQHYLRVIGLAPEPA
jgi:transposase